MSIIKKQKATTIEQTSDYRFVTDEEKTRWDAKVSSDDPRLSGSSNQYEPANSNIQAHISSPHAPADAQKNSDITKAEIEAKLTGPITSHTHAGASIAITEVEVDLGSTPVSEASIPVVDAGVTVNSKILGGIAYKAPTGKDLDELEMDALDLKFEPGVGTFNVKIKGLEGYISDKFIIWYTLA